MTALLDASGISKRYGAMPVLKDVDLTVEPGEAHVIIGPNGAGKTTLLKVLSGELLCDTGQVMLDGRDVTALPGWRRVTRGLGRTFQVARVFGELSVIANLLIAVEASGGHGGLRSLSLRPGQQARARADQLVEQMGLHPLADQAAGSLSHGDKKRLELAMALAGRPRVLLLDEPTAGMAAPDRKACVALLSGVMREHGVSLLLTEHDLGVVFTLGTRLTVLSGGAVIASGDPLTVREDPTVRQVYLGHGTLAS